MVNPLWYQIETSVGSHPYEMHKKYNWLIENVLLSHAQVMFAFKDKADLVFPMFYHQTWSWINNWQHLYCPTVCVQLLWIEEASESEI